MTKLTASNLWRAELCPASAVLPWEKKVYADAARGVEEHALREANPPPGSQPEVAFVFNVLLGSARLVGQSIGRNYGKLEDGDIPGTADLVTVPADADHVLVDDYKTGTGHAEKCAGVFDNPEKNAQLQHYSLCAALVYGRQRAIAQVIYLSTGEVKDAVFDLFDFAAIKARFRTVWAATMDDDPPVVMDRDRQCWRCPAKKACPEWAKGRKAA